MDIGQCGRLPSMTGLVNKEGHEKKAAQLEEEGEKGFCFTLSTETYWNCIFHMQ